jgi:predicted phosphodiesterase
MIACLYDVHGNLSALEAVLDDANSNGATEFVLGGDYALFGAWPVECVERLRLLDNATWIRGNVDRWVAGLGDLPSDDERRDAIADCRALLGEETAAWLGELPEAAIVGDQRVVHASPVSDVRSFLPQPGPDDEEMLAGTTERRLLFGHTHLAFRREMDGVELVNPGSVGMPLDGDTRAAYALISDDGTLEHRRVAYGTGAAIQALAERFDGAPWAATIAERLRTARF